MDKALPSDIEAERATLGSLLLNRDAIVAVDGWLQPDHFWLEKHAWIYEAIQTCYRNRIAPDSIAVSGELRRCGRLEAVGGLLYLIELGNATPTSVHVETYAKTVKQTSTLRRLISAGSKIAALGFDERDELESTLLKAEEMLAEVSGDQASRDYVPLREIVDLYADQLLDPNREGAVGLRTGFGDLDEMTGGLHRGNVIVLAARPGVGKTSFALNVAENVAAAGGKVGVISLEMSSEELRERLVSSRTGIDIQRIRTGAIREDDRAQMMVALARLSGLSMFIDDTPGQTIQQVRAKARRLHAAVGLDLLVLDYLQLMEGAGDAKNREGEVAKISRGLKILARELQIPLIALSQLNRAVEGRASHVPMLSDLRESGAIEQDSDIVIFIYREELYDKETDKKGIAELHIAKHRNGPTGVIPLRFDANTTRFLSLERYRSPDGY